MVDYYVSSTGNDSANGSAGTPWATLKKFNDVQAGGTIGRTDRLFIEAGKVHYGQIITTGISTSGTGQFQILPFGHGAAPEINGYKVSRDMWVEHTPGVWKLDISANSAQITGYVTGTSTDVGHLRDGSNYRGVKRDRLVDETITVDGQQVFRPGLNNEWDFYSDAQYVYVKKATSPGADIRIATRHSGFVAGSYVTLTGLSFKGFGAHGASIAGKTSVEVVGNVFASLGGAYRATPVGTIERYGNGIEVFLNGRNITITGNRIRQTFDVGFTVQGNVQTGSGASQRILFARNWVENCNQSIEFWAQNSNPTGNSIYEVQVLENVCVNAGVSWAAQVRADNTGKGIHLLTYDMQGIIDITVARNVFYGAADAFAYHRPVKPSGVKVFDNTIILPVGKKIAWQTAETIDEPGANPYVDNSRLIVVPNPPSTPDEVVDFITASTAAQTTFATEASRYWRASAVAG